MTNNKRNKYNNNKENIENKNIKAKKRKKNKKKINNINNNLSLPYIKKKNSTDLNKYYKKKIIIILKSYKKLFKKHKLILFIIFLFFIINILIYNDLFDNDDINNNINNDYYSINIKNYINLKNIKKKITINFNFNNNYDDNYDEDDDNDINNNNNNNLKQVHDDKSYKIRTTKEIINYLIPKYPTRHRRLSASRTYKYVNKDTKLPLKLNKLVHSPILHSKTHQRTFGCLRQECRGLALEDLSDRKWRLIFKSAKNADGTFRSVNYRVTFVLTDNTELAKLKKQHINYYNTIINNNIGRVYVSAIGNADAIGGNKGQQLRNKMKLAERHKCTYNSLSIQPAQYRLYDKNECQSLINRIGKQDTYLLKPETGSQGHGITFHKDVQSIQKKLKKTNFFPCNDDQKNMSATERMLVQEYINRPLLIQKSKFDIRIYMLIASTDPYLVFYHQGYLRRALFPYSPLSKDRKVYLTNTHYQSMKEGFKLSQHIWTFKNFQDYLTTTGKTGSHYVESILEPYIKRVSNFVFQSAKSKLIRRKGSFQIFGLDFMIDDRFRTHFIEANGYPGYTWSINFDTRGLVTTQFDLLLEINESPSFASHLRAGDNYGGYELLYSELEEELYTNAYDSCWEFNNNIKSFDSLMIANRHFAQYTGHAASQIINTDTNFEDDDEPNNTKCRTKKCHAEKKLKKKLAYKAKLKADRMFSNNYNDDLLLNNNDNNIILIGNSKIDELNILNTYTKNFSCSLNKLGIMPHSYRLNNKNDINNLYKFKTPNQWLVKPSDHIGRRGRGFKFFNHQKDIEDEFGTENTNKLYVAQKKINNKLIINNSTWDLRSYMLIASLDPFLVYYYPGYVRSSEWDEEAMEYKLEKRKALTFEDLQAMINVERIAGAHFVETILESFMQRVMILLFESMKNQLEILRLDKRNLNSYQLFELNFIVDEHLRPYYVGGANGKPEFTLRKGAKGEPQISKNMMESLKSLILESHDIPEAFSFMARGAKYDKFRLIYSEYDNAKRNISYNPCFEFKKKYGIPKNEAKQIAEIHDVSGRSYAANVRERNKYIKAKWQSCRVKKTVQSCGNDEYVKNYIKKRYLLFLEKERLRLGGSIYTSKNVKLNLDRNSPEVIEWVENEIKALKERSHELSSSSSSSSSKS